MCETAPDERITYYIGGLLKAEEEFLEHLDSLTTFEGTVSKLSNRMAAGHRLKIRTISGMNFKYKIWKVTFKM